MVETMRGSLTEKERKVLDMRFGLSGDLNRTGEEVDAAFSATRERIREIEEKALRKLRERADRPSVDDVLNEER